MKFEIDYETADRIVLDRLKDQLSYLEKEQQWFETEVDSREQLELQWGHGIYVHPDDYENNRDRYIPALKLLIEYFGG